VRNIIAGGFGAQDTFGFVS